LLIIVLLLRSICCIFSFHHGDCSCQDLWNPKSKDRRRRFLQNGRSPPYAHGLLLHNKHLRGDDLQVQYRRPLKISAYNTSDILLDNPRLSLSRVQLWICCTHSVASLLMNFYVSILLRSLHLYIAS
jgi:hypothetical protein